MSQTEIPSRKLPPRNPFPHAMVRLDPANPAQYVESVVYDKATGEKLIRFPVDARELVASGAYSYDPPAPEGPEAA